MTTTNADECMPSDQDIEEFYVLGRVEYSPGSGVTPANARDEFRTFLAHVRRDTSINNGVNKRITGDENPERLYQS